MVTAIGFSQDHWKGFFKPVDKNLITLKTKEVTPSVWLFRPAVEISALQLTYNKTTKGFDASSLKQAGAGIGYQHFVESNGLPYNNFGFNALLLFDLIPTETTNAGVSGALTVSALQFLNVGAGYNITAKKFFILTGITFNFK